jgi:hypothetical protein
LAAQVPRGTFVTVIFMVSWVKISSTHKARRSKWMVRRSQINIQPKQQISKIEDTHICCGCIACGGIRNFKPLNETMDSQGAGDTVCGAARIPQAKAITVKIMARIVK